MRSRRTSIFAGNCLHTETIAVRSVGMERIVCEKCGHISFSSPGDSPESDEQDRDDRLHPAEA